MQLVLIKMMRRITVLIFSLLLILTASNMSYCLTGNDFLEQAQTHFTNSSIDSALWYCQKAESYFKEKDSDKYVEALFLHSQLNIETGEFASANEFLNTAERILENKSENQNIHLIDLYAIRGTVYLYSNDFNESVIWLKKSIELAQSINYDDKKVLASVYNDLASNYYFLGDYEKTIILFTKALELNKDNKNTEGIVTNLNNLGALYQSIGEYQKSIDYLNEALVLDLKKGNSTDITIYLNNIGNNYLKLGQFEMALEYFTRAQKIDIETGNNAQIAVDLNNIAWIQKENGDFLSAIDNFNKASIIFKELKDDLSSAKCLDNLGDMYREICDYEKSKIALSNANKIFSNTGHLKDKAVNLNNTGRLCLATGNISEAIQSHQEAIEINKKLNILQGIASNYNNLGKIYLHEKDFKKALDYYHKSLIVLIPGFIDDDVLSVPGKDSIPVEKELLIAVKSKAEIFYAFYNNSKENIHSLKSSFDNYFLATEIIDKMRISYYTDDKYSLSKTEKNTYETALSIANILYTKTGESYYLNKAWEISEKSKASYLYELIRENEAKLYSNIPDSILLREKVIKSKIFDLERLIREENSKSSKDIHLIDSLKSELFNKKFHELENIKRGLETNFPEYYQLKYDNTIYDLNTAKKFAGKSNSVIEYYLGTESLFVFLINRDSVILKEIPINERFRSAVITLRDYLSNTYQSGERFTSFSENAYYIYSVLFGEITPFIKKKNLIIIPDGILGYIPFEVLFTSEVNSDNTYYKDSPYLIKEHAVSYSYSLTLLINSYRKRLNIPQKELMAIAPSFSMNDKLPAFLTERGEEFIDLIGSRIEVKSINKIFKGEQYIDSIATESNFKKFAADYKILHIATHGLIDDEDPMNSRLLFFRNNDTIQDGDLYTYELFNMQLSAELAVLSACNTGYGKLEEGEGIISLARGFLYAGVPSIVMTLWSVPDGTSAIIIENFYRYLKNGYPKNVALQNAKLDYLRKADNLKANPYFWAGFVNIGNTDKFTKKEIGNWYFWLIGVLLVTLVALSYKKLRKSI